MGTRSATPRAGGLPRSNGMVVGQRSSERAASSEASLPGSPGATHHKWNNCSVSAGYRDTLAHMDFVRPIEAIVPGAQGRVLAVLAETTAELNLRTIAKLAGVSIAQASRVLPGLVELGVVERREVPPSSLFRLVPEHVASRTLLALARSAETVLNEMGRLADALPRSPLSVIVFGSFARGEAGPDSDVDIVVVRPAGIHEDDDAWAESLEGWRRDVARLTGNPVEVLEVSAAEAAAKVAGRSQLWSDIRSDGRVVHGLDLDQLRAVRSG